ncbi:unnamed protein product [Parnassius apollo]|uniref:(apollo) hypothetical protein n=1 Tax=Parnassius apollo TaxID=110799 RepID=A0A8S3Y110_PARAO|nr:unnamed protein product [Parnassius apollo]
MIPYYGRRFGFKAWTAATRLGYGVHADLYEGKSEQRSTRLGEHVVTKMMEAMQKESPETQFSVFCDNFFTSPTLISNLQDKNIKVTGTMRQNRIDKCPLMDVKSVKKQQRGYYDYHLDTNDQICAVRWNDNSVVTLLSNEYGVHPIQKAKRYSAVEKKKVNIQQPYVVQQYNRFTGGVD